MATISPDIPAVATMADTELSTARPVLGDRVSALSARRELDGTTPDLDASIEAYSQLLHAVDEERASRQTAQPAVVV